VLEDEPPSADRRLARCRVFARVDFMRYVIRQDAYAFPVQ
jgi:hypothetical protein